MFQEIDEPLTCYYFHADHCRVYTGSMIGSNGERAVVDFGPGFGTAFPFLCDLYQEKLPALLELQRHLTKRLRTVGVEIMALDGSLESATVSVKSE